MKDRNKMNIGIIVDSLRNGGAERVAARLSQYFSKKNEVYIFTNTYNRRKDYPIGGRVILLKRQDKINNRWEELKDIVDVTRQLRKYKREFSLDACISFVPEYNLVNILSKREEKCIVSIHSVQSLRKEWRHLIAHKKYIFKYLYRMADKVVTVSQYCKNDLVENLGVNEKKIQVIGNPIPMIKEEECDNFPKKYILYCGRLDEVKQVWHIIWAYYIVEKKHPETEMLILGEGKEKTDLLRLSQQLGVEEKVKFGGFKDDIYSYMKESYCLVLSSKSEAFSCVAAEALSVGCPVVATDSPGGIREIVAPNTVWRGKMSKYEIGECGILTSSMTEKWNKKRKGITKNEKQLADAIIYMIEHNDLTWHKKCINRAGQFFMERIGPQWDELLS